MLSNSLYVDSHEYLLVKKGQLLSDVQGRQRFEGILGARLHNTTKIISNEILKINVKLSI